MRDIPISPMGGTLSRMNRILQWIRGDDHTPCTTCGHDAGHHREQGIDWPCCDCECHDLIGAT